MAYNMMQDHLTNSALQNTQWRNMRQMGLVDDPLAEEMERDMRKRMTASRRGNEEAHEEDMEEMKRKYEERLAQAEERQKDLMEKTAGR